MALQKANCTRGQSGVTHPEEKNDLDHEAIEAGDANSVAQILDREPEQLETPNAIGVIAARSLRRLQQPIIRLLLEKGAAVNAIGNRGYTPLHYVTLEMGGPGSSF